MVLSSQKHKLVLLNKFKLEMFITQIVLLEMDDN